jgi:hypothetical protein
MGTIRFSAQVSPYQRSALTVVDSACSRFHILHLNEKRALTAEDVRVQEFIAEFALRVVLLAQLNKVGQPLIN